MQLSRLARTNTAAIVLIGDGLKSLITDAAITSITSHMNPYIRTRNFGGALERAITEIDLVLSGKENEIKQLYPEVTGGERIEILFWTVIVVVVIVISARACYLNRKNIGLTQSIISFASLPKLPKSLPHSK